ncbi:cation-translocating P-type ATPase [Undibacterium sp. Ji22W]|uniref:cation-translocating P-type ATPase n=1 Tax=Undibacterium sp. Ji22W TaxID=3413038 RepID=UPI003BF1B465
MQSSSPQNFEGLSQQQATLRLQQDGLNELPTAQPQNLLQIAWHVISEPMILLLIACATIYLILGDWHEAIVLCGFVIAMLIISFYQEHKTERALEALRDLSNPRATVIRDGNQHSIPSNEVVCGDYLVLNEGDRIAADGILIRNLNLSVDESLLTGESVAVSKDLIPDLMQLDTLSMGSAGGDHTSFVFSGCLVVQGKGLAVVKRVGASTAIGQIGQALASIQEEPTNVQKETRQVVKYVAIASIALAVLLAIWFGFSRGDWLRGSLVGLTFAMAMIPEELPIVLSIFLGIGAWRIGQKQVLTRRIPAIETLGSASVLCVDKTGTLTQNKMALAYIVTAQEKFVCQSGQDLPEEFHQVLEYAILASQTQGNEPMDQALHQAGDVYLKGTEHLHQEWMLLEEYPLSKELMAISRAWRSSNQQQARVLIASKGAPEAIADLCHLDANRIKQLMVQVNQMAEQGLRVLAVAKAEFSDPSNDANKLPELAHDYDFELLGLIAFADPIRDGVPAAIQECRSAGIRVIMITGDYPATAINIANQCGIDSSAGVLTGQEMLTLSDVELQEKLKKIHICCRVMPEQKLRIVNLLKQSDAIVAMTGDGVNDAPALKAAHIGIAMGKRGTDVARESAALVLLDDAFSSIVAAVRLGRRIFDNLRKTLSFIIAAHIPIIGCSFLPVIFGWPVLLMPVHILILELIIDPSCSLVFEAEEEEDSIMQRPPRSITTSLFQSTVLWRGFWQGCGIFLTVLAIYGISVSLGIAEEETRAITFAAIVTGNLGLIFLNRSLTGNLRYALSSPNPILWWVCAAATLIMVLVFTLPGLRHLFYFGNPHPSDLLISVAITILTVGLIALFQGLSLKNSK